MAPSTRRSRHIAANIQAALSQTNGAASENALDLPSPDLASISTQRAAGNQNNPNLSGVRAKHGKRTFVSTDTAPSPAPVPTETFQGIPSKRTRVTASSFYPGRRSDNTHPLASLQVNSSNHFAHNYDFNEDDIENEDDWLEDEEVVNVTRKVSAKTSEVTATERPSWLGADVTPPGTMEIPSRNVLDADASSSPMDHGSAASTPRSRTLSELGAPNTELSASATMLQTEATTESSGAAWPADTDLLPPGANKLMLTNQNPLVHNVVQEAIENLRASLMFNHSFPTAPVAFTFTKESLITAAEKYKPGAAHIQRRLQQDGEYLVKIVPLVRVRVPLMRSEIKERCNAYCVPALVSIGSASNIAQVVRLQVSNFNYTFPTKRGLFVGTPLRTHPYRNECIISVIRDLFFTGGMSSFASRFAHLFPEHQGHDGVSTREVPVPMVALVVTAMYATLHEWRTGKQQGTEFSANTYLDVYRCNANTLNFILNQRPNAYHVMMADIYTQASSDSEHDGLPGAVIADLDLDDLEG
ncbi:hypothetical protein H4582DRAFT_2054425 [Lactarius indigo]|nr:hypothetical protein H4582DRAFT_2054425 [Lactarius indigo]